MNQEDIPMVLTVREVGDILRVGLGKAYEIVNTPSFPAKKIGARIIIPREAFLNWLNTTRKSE